jgi:hypothetical protein
MATRCLTRSISALFGCAVGINLVAASGCAMLNTDYYRNTPTAEICHG